MPSVVSGRSPGDSPQFQNTCFGCGAANTNGLQLKFRIEANGTTTASLVPDARWEGLRGTLHGGIVATLLDEAMAKAVAAKGHQMMTVELRVRLHAPARTGDQLQVTGWVVSDRSRLVEAEASLRSADGRECAHGWGKFLQWTKPGHDGGSDKTL